MFVQFQILFVQIDTATPEAERILEFFALEKKDVSSEQITP